MLLSLKEKQFLMELLDKEKNHFWRSKENRRMAEELYEKFKQNTRNERINDMKQSKL